MEKYSVLSRADPVVWRRRATGVTGIGESMADNRTSSKNRLTRSFLLAFEDTEFLQKDELRSQRLALEFNKVDLALIE
jgi:hypothetical protein